MELSKTRTVPEVLEVLARRAWYLSHESDPGKREACPSDMIPSESDLVEWLPECPESDRQESAQLVDAMLSPPAQLLGLTFPLDPKVKRQSPSVVFKPVGLLQNMEPVIELFGKHLQVYEVLEAMTWGHLWKLWMDRASKSFPVLDRTSLETLHWVWRTLPAQDRPQHFLAPLLRAWQKRGKPIDSDGRPDTIMHQGVFDWAADAPSIITRRHDNDFAVELGLIETEAQMLLPGMPKDPDNDIVSASALILADAVGFGRLNPGRGARLDKRNLVYPLLRIPQSERRPGGRYTWRPTLGEYVENYLFVAPSKTGAGKGKSSLWRPSRHAPMLQRSLNAVSLVGIRLITGQEWRPVMVRALPDFWNPDSRIVFDMLLPEDPVHGALVRWDPLIEGGMKSDPAFDGVLALATLWDQVKAKNGGFRIYATRPKALRDRQGQLTRADGTLILGDARNPFKSRNGRLTWRTGDTPQMDWRHPGAEFVGEERHPKADNVPTLGRRGRRRLFFGRVSDGLPSYGRSRAADRADSLLQEMQNRGHVVIEVEPDGWRILEPWRKRLPSLHIGRPDVQGVQS